MATSLSLLHLHIPSNLSLPSHSRSHLYAPGHRSPPRPRLAAAGPIRSAVGVPSGFDRGGGVETDKLPSGVRERAMWAIDSCGGRVTIGDVAGKAGLKLNEAEKALQAIAADTGGFLEVSDEGDVLYVFSRDYRAKLAGKSFKMKVEPLLQKSKDAAEYIIRVSFGTALVASIALVYTSIIVILSSKSDEDNRGRRGGRPYDSGFSVYFRPSDLFWYWDPYYYRRQQPRSSGGLNFIESVFSFVFGDGDPNEGIEEERWKLIGEYIASNGGVVAAEELAPYLDVPVSGESMEDESYILPVLLRFEGHPEVDDEGNILYFFPSLQRSAVSGRSGKKEYVGKRWRDWVGGMQNFFKERTWQFSKTGVAERAMVAGLGALNLLGVVILSSILKDTTAPSGGLISFVIPILPLLQAYAASFFAIPFFRWLFLVKTNNKIQNRNIAREKRALALERADVSLRKKLLSARDMAQRTVISQDRIIYRTQDDLVDQDLEAKEWDRRFRGLDRS